MSMPPMVQVTMQKPTGAARAMPSGMLRDSEKGIATERSR